jgi:pyruvate dehydrogenase E1 component alpha subunit
MAELFGKATGCSAGKGGSMHFVDASKNFMGGYAIVAGQLTLAVGLAQAAQYLGEDRVVMVFFGDGAVNQGEFHESMNLASLWKLPIVFFLENNFYGMGSHIDRTYAGGRDVYKSGDHYGMPSKQVDGMDVLEVYQATQDIVQQVRSGGGPFFVEALTYRFRGHSMADPVQYRGRTEEDLWRSRDPILTFTNHILEGQFATADDLKRLDTEVAKEIAEAVQFAEESPEPEADALYRDIYS